MIYFGAGLQLIGLVVLGYGFRQTWHAHRYSDKRNLPAFVLQPLGDGATAAAQRVGSGLRRLAWRRDSGVTVHAEAAGAYGYAGITARAVREWSALPDPTVDMDAFAAKVHERLSRLHAMVHESQDALAREQEAREAAEQEIKSTVEREIARLEAQSHGVATGGLRWEVWGWLFLVAGLIVSTCAAI